MSTPAPGGYLDQDQVIELRNAAAYNRRVAQRLHGSVTMRQGEPGLIAIYERRIAALQAAEALLLTITNGARIDALPSPEEEAAQEAAYRIERLVEQMHPADAEAYLGSGTVKITKAGIHRLTEALGRPPTEDELARMLAELRGTG